MNINEMEIFPVIFCYNLNTEIRPRIELMRSKNKFIPLKQAFSLDKKEFAKVINASEDDFNKLVRDPAPQYERDLTFRYSKYLSI
jgi:hypothetical protein